MIPLRKIIKIYQTDRAVKDLSPNQIEIMEMVEVCLEWEATIHLEIRMVDLLWD